LKVQRREIIALPDGTLANDVAQAGDKVVGGWQIASRDYGLGDRLSFDVQDFADFCWTFYAFGELLRDKLWAYLRAKGIPKV
jgi:hypothetical protein